MTAKRKKEKNKILGMPYNPSYIRTSGEGQIWEHKMINGR
jgi:hypothetical protein